MSKQSMKEMGDKTQSKLFKALSKKAKTPEDIAKKVGVTPLYARSLLREAVKDGKAIAERQGRFILYRAKIEKGMAVPPPTPD